MTNDTREKQWYWRREGVQHGPASWAHLVSLVGSDELLASDEVWAPGELDWKEAADVPGLYLPPGTSGAGASSAPPACRTTERADHSSDHEVEATSRKPSAPPRPPQAENQTASSTTRGVPWSQWNARQWIAARVSGLLLLVAVIWGAVTAGAGGAVFIALSSLIFYWPLCYGVILLLRTREGADLERAPRRPVPWLELLGIAVISAVTLIGLLFLRSDSPLTGEARPLTIALLIAWPLAWLFGLPFPLLARHLISRRPSGLTTLVACLVNGLIINTGLFLVATLAFGYEGAPRSGVGALFTVWATWVILRVGWEDSRTNGEPDETPRRASTSPVSPGSAKRAKPGTASRASADDAFLRYAAVVEKAQGEPPRSIEPATRVGGGVLDTPVPRWVLVVAVALVLAALASTLFKW